MIEGSGVRGNALAGHADGTVCWTADGKSAAEKGLRVLQWDGEHGVIYEGQFG